MKTIELTFWIAVGVSIYVQIGYFVLLWCLSFLRKQESQSYSCYEPFVSLIIAAYNEEKNISRKIENTLRLDYPRNKIEIIVFSDGSTDGTDEIVRQYAIHGVQLIRVDGRKGKTYCQDVAVRHSGGDIIIFTDADALLEPDVIRKMVRHFTDPSIGCVTCKMCYLDQSGESWYQKYETSLFDLESRLSSPVGAFGPLYAIRRDLYEPLPPELQEDLVRPLLVVYRHCRIVFEKEAVVWLHSTASVRKEASRRVRMVAQAVYSLIYYPPMRALLNPIRYGLFALQMWSHRILRWIHGVFLILILISNYILCFHNSFYLLLLFPQMLFYLCASLGYWYEARNSQRAHALLHFAYYYLSAQFAMLHGFWLGMRGVRLAKWQPVR